MLPALISILIIVSIIGWIYKRKKLSDSLPNGPTPWPFVGNLFQFDEKDMRRTILAWHKRYGPIFTVWNGMTPEIYVTGYDAMVELFVKRGDEFVDRPQDWVGEYFSSGKYGIINCSGEQVREQRRFTLQTLRNFGFGRKVMEEKVKCESDKLIQRIEEKLKKSKSGVLNLKPDIELCVGNIISSLVVGKTYEEDDHSFDRLKTLIGESFDVSAKFTVILLGSFPWLRFAPVFGHFGLDEVNRIKTALMTILLDEVAKHKKELEESAEPTDFTAAYLQEMKKRKDSGQDLSYFSEHQLVNVMIDLWSAGLETTVTTLGWAILLMMTHPDVQTKMHRELDAVLGVEKEPELSDKNRLPYTNAVIMEIQRYANIAPTNFGRRIVKDTDVGGRLFPAGITFIPQIPVVAMDDAIFADPDRFNPDRFLESDGSTLKKCDQLLPFSLGKRSCLGESLARLELFVLFASLVQKFRFSVDPHGARPSLEPVVKFTVCAQPYECLVTPRI